MLVSAAVHPDARIVVNSVLVPGRLPQIHAAKLEVETGSGRPKPSGPAVVVQPAASYTRQWRSCRA
jgi:hypothetical protein